MITAESFLFQFSEQVKYFVGLEPDPEKRCFIIDGNRFAPEDIIAIMLNGYNL